MRYPEKLIDGGEGVALDSAKPSPPQMLSVLSRRLPSLYRYAYRLLGNKTDAEDAVQDALLAAYKHLNQFRGDAQLSTWLTTIVINCARMHLRKRSRYIHVSLDSRIGEDQEYSLSDILVDHRPNPEDECHRSTLNARLMKSAAQLSPTLRKTFHLRFVHHLSICETARILGVPAGTVKAQTARARAKLLKAMRGLLHLGPAERKSCSPRRPHRNNPAVPAIKPEATSFIPSHRQLLAGP
ncbi:MAG: sigma-70 family RNA polymerase sigma factor [Candidatus Sulfotelmatobacter sp.]